MNSTDDILIKRKTYIYTIGWISIIFSGLLIYFYLFEIIKLIILSKNLKEFGVSENFTILNGSYQTYYYIYIILVLIGIMFLITSIGLLNLKNWARKIYMSMSLALIFAGIIAIIYYILLTEKFVMKIFGLDIQTINNINPIFLTLLKIKSISYLLLLIVFLRTLSRIIFNFRKEEFKMLFY